jgi:hypothetical protein
MKGYFSEGTIKDFKLLCMMELYIIEPKMTYI